MVFNPNKFRPDPKPEKKEKSKPGKIKPRADKRAKQERIYNKIRPVFLEGKICPITKQPATEIHHKKGRIGDLLIDIRYFLAVSDEGHKKIEANPEWAKKMGYSLSRLSKDDDNGETTGHNDPGGGQEDPARED